MTRKNYSAIASAISQAIDNDINECHAYSIALNLCQVFRDDNINFSDVKFLDACGLLEYHNSL